ncbi:hypothetical protein [Tenacibaculum sp. IB213877]|uniref:hypothetical protein n=1 Tax=Tenacibaculum sp. IB213877 TaxID=3097351 RepID=UPI002A5ACF5E|nr:hypothetical protein [Tenacibaculum sp. IB213877]MDY0779355.1 hypothetical protein [Tenacibaculum sp. IB213877]
MKKKIINILLLLVACMGYGQEYKYYTSTTNFISLSASNCYGANPLATIQAKGSINIIDVNNDTLSEESGVFEFDTRPVNYKVSFGSCRWLEGPSSGSTFGLGGYTITINESLDSYYEIKKGNDGTLFGALYFEKRDLSEINEIECNGLNLNATSSVAASDIIEWQYSFDGNLETINNSQNKSSVFIDYDNFAVNFSENTGKTIFFRYKLVGDVFSPLKAYTIISCSPPLIGVFPQETKCAYTNDGSFRIDLKRGLYSNEKLAIILYRKNDFTDEFDIILDQNLNITTLEKIDETTYRHSWTNTLPKGIYKLKYQTGKKGSDISPDDISWNSLIPVDLEIKSSEAVTFSITAHADKTCFEVNDGFIELKANGESGRTFFYQLQRDNIIQNAGTNGGWLPFTGANNTTTINSLSKARYTIKVRDSNSNPCYAKE